MVRPRLIAIVFKALSIILLSCLIYVTLKVSLFFVLMGSIVFAMVT